MITTKTLYRVPNSAIKCDLIIGFWISENPEIRNMGINEAFENAKCIDETIIDESIKNCIIFTFYDAVNYGLEEDEFREFTFDELIAECEKVEMITCE